jgi:hypothetical protein
MKHLKTINELFASTDYKLPEYERSRDISEEEFLEILRTHCQNFSLDNDPLYRMKSKKGDLQLFTPMPRNAKPVAFPKFFNDIENNPDYPVIRKNSLIGGTNLTVLKVLISDIPPYHVIPFDGSELVFCPVMDLWALADDPSKWNHRRGENQLIGGKEPGMENFIKVTYEKGFRIPSVELNKLPNAKGKTKMGEAYEFFISSPCLLIHDSKMDWLRNNL